MTNNAGSGGVNSESLRFGQFTDAHHFEMGTGSGSLWRPSRRSFLAAGLASAGALALSSCTAGSGVQQAPTSDGKPQRGGKLRVGCITGGTAEILVPSFTSVADNSRSQTLYSRLFDRGADGKLVPNLALSAEPNSDATIWTFKLRDHVVFHNGKPFGADDVVWTIQSWAEPESGTAGGFNSFIDYKAVRKLDRLTVEVPLLVPVAQFDTLVAHQPIFGITPAGVTLKELAKNPIGTGPFKFKSFKAGTQSVFAANENYWESDKPYVDSLVINSSFSDPDALYNALLAREIDVLAQLPPRYAKQQETLKQFNILRASGSTPMYMFMNTQQAPMNDPRVRRAVRLVADRQQLIDNALLGYGQPANDLFGPGLEYYADDLKISQDIDQAKSLLRAAGQENPVITLDTSPTIPGGVEAATLLAQQAKQAGINIKVNSIPAANYWTTWPSKTMGQDYYSTPLPSLTAWYQSTVINLKETKWNPKDPTLSAAIGTVDPAKAADLWHQFQKSQIEDGGYLIWTMFDVMDGLASNVHGIKPSGAANLGGWRLQDAWLS